MRIKGHFTDDWNGANRYKNNCSDHTHLKIMKLLMKQNKRRNHSSDWNATITCQRLMKSYKFKKKSFSHYQQQWWKLRFCNRRENHKLQMIKSLLWLFTLEEESLMLPGEREHHSYDQIVSNKH